MCPPAWRNIFIKPYSNCDFPMKIGPNRNEKDGLTVISSTPYPISFCIFVLTPATKYQ